MPERRIIAVVGATGAQGGGLARAILDDPDAGFALRALTRKIASAPAQALAARGAEVLAADLDDPASLRRAFAGAHGAFCVTNYWEHFSPERETAQARALAQAAAGVGVAHVVWSTLEDTRRWVPLSDERFPTLQGRYKVPHFDAKAEADDHFRRAGAPTTFLLTSFYWENLARAGMNPRPGPGGELVFALPMGDRKLPGIAVEDIGRCALGLFKRGGEFIGRTVGVAGEHLTGAQMAAALAAALGRSVDYKAVPPAAYRALGFPGAEDLGNMFQFNQDFEADFCAARNLELARALNPSLQTFAQWLTANRERVPLT